ncbi:MAG: adenine nucleotide alpha hydrolase family protein [Candidatus Latescibacteria bacterium]|nr:adenine nucleotide alpha hydrolase family protein [Candidatus Latescibacterota bacterium]
MISISNLTEKDSVKHTDSNLRIKSGSISASRIQKISHTYFRKAVTKHQLLNDGERVLVAVSGGIDSLVLIHLISNYNQRKRKNWDILAVHIKPNFPNWKTTALRTFLERQRIKYLISDIDISKKIDLREFSICYVCARERRKRLFEIAEQHKINKIAFAHHLEDVNETFLMNLIYNSKTATFLPKQSFFQNRFFIVRPLYYFDKELILQYSKAYDIKKINNRCPYEKKNERGQIRKFLKSLEEKNPRIKTNIFWGINNIKYEYLP